MEKPEPVIISPEAIAPLVHWLRHEKVMLDSDLAELYGVPTKVLNQAVKRNADRFPTDFMFQPELFGMVPAWQKLFLPGDSNMCW